MIQYRIFIIVCQKSGIYESIRDAEFVYGIKYVHENLNKDGDLNKNAKGFNSNMLHKAHIVVKKVK